MTRGLFSTFAMCWAAAAMAAAPAKMFSIGGVDVILRQSTASQVVSGTLFIKGGTSAVPPSVSVATEPMALGIIAESGPADMGREEYQRRLSRMVSSIGSNTGKDFSQFSLHCVREHFAETWSLFTRVLMNPGFDSIEVIKNKRATITAIKSIRSSPDAFVSFLADSLYFQGHPYERHATVEEVQAVTVDAMRAYLREVLVKSRLLLVIVGDVSEKDVREGVMATFAKLSDGRYVAPVLPAPTQASAHGAVVVDRRLPTTYIQGVCAEPNRRQPDYWASVICAITLNNRLFEEVRTKRNLSYAPAAWVNPNETATGMLYVTTVFPDSALRVMFACVDSMQNVPMSPEELKAQVAGFITQVYLRDETTARQCEALGRYQLLTGSWENSLHVVERVQALQPRDIQEVARKYIHNFSFAAVGKADKIDKALLESR